MSRERTNVTLGTTALKREAREDADIFRLLMSQMWPVPEEAREDLVQRQLEIAGDPLVSAVARAMAARNVIACGASNLKAIDMLMHARDARAYSPANNNIYASDAEIREGLQKLLEVAPTELPETEQPQEETTREWRVA